MSSIPNNATGIWPAKCFGASAEFCAGIAGDNYISEKDKTILQRLAQKVQILSERSQETEKRDLWFKHNDLKEKYPVILTDPENGWNEIITADMLQCAGDMARKWEWILQRDIFWSEKIQDDRPVESLFEIGYTFKDTEWGLEGLYHGGQNGTSYAWEPAIHTVEEINNIQKPVVTVDYTTTEETLNIARNIFGNILEVKLSGLNWHSPHMTWDLSKMVGLENMMIMMYDDPDFLKRIMEKFVSGHMARLDFLEKERLLALNNNNSYVGSGGIGYTRDLPHRQMENSNTILTSDQWLHTESQETVNVSPDMFEEFIFPYQLQIQKRFGLNCYGCCEPLESKWHIIKNIPNLRRVSVSPWADDEKMAQNLGDQYIYSKKPNPSDLAIPKIDELHIRKNLHNMLSASKGCVVELVMKDNHSLGKNPDNIIHWVKIAREEIKKIYGA
jgi:hypothetical protein